MLQVPPRSQSRHLARKGGIQLPSETSHSTSQSNRNKLLSCVVLGHKMEMQEILETKKHDTSPATCGSCATKAAEELSALAGGGQKIV
jgi:hypothetical protein